MEKFYKIDSELNLNAKDHQKAFESDYQKLKDLLVKSPVKTLTYYEAFLAWLLVIKYKPKAIVEIGGQYGHSGQLWWRAAQRVGSTFLTVELGLDPRNKYKLDRPLKFLPDNEKNLIKVWGMAEEKVPELLVNYPVELVFHDALHTWDHVESLVKTVLDHDSKIIQTCHDCAEGMWKPEKETVYGYVHAERPIFDKYFKNEEYYYNTLEEKYGFGLAIHNKRLMD